MKEIPLLFRAGKKHFALVDDDVYDWAHKLPLRPIDGRRGKIYAGFKRAGSTHYLHHLIYGVPPQGMVVDHRNGNSLDNQRRNLRMATRSQNAVNRPGRSASGFKGVRYCNRRKCWVAYVRVNGRRQQSLGFETALQAAAAYNELAAKHWGEFAWLNPISKPPSASAPDLPAVQPALLRRGKGGVFHLKIPSRIEREAYISLRTKDETEALSKAGPILETFTKIYGLKNLMQKK